MATGSKKSTAPATVAEPQNASYACKVPATAAANARAAGAATGDSQAVHVSAHAQKPTAPRPQIRICEHGPYAVDARVPLHEDALVHDDNRQCMTYRHVRDIDTDAHVQDGAYHLCRCGHSKDKPFCDGSHAAAHFDGAEVASTMPYTARANLYQGPDVDLLDDNRCAFARLCHRQNQDVWTLTEHSDTPERKELAVEAAWECPTGRLTSYDNGTHQVYEEHWEPSVTVLEDVQEKAAGPLFVRGGCELLGADGHAYESRNRYALCRCGRTKNGPFCDAEHIPAHFLDESPVWDESADPGSLPLDDTLNRKPSTYR